VPLFGYISGDHVEFPSHIDFGTVHVGHRVQKRIPIHSRLPVNLEFSLHNSNPQSDFKITPSDGIIPGKGSAVLILSFQPLTLTGNSVKRCAVSGRARSGSVRDEKLAAYIKSFPARITMLDSLDVLEESHRKTLAYSAFGGAGHGDAYTEALWRKKRLSLAPLEVRPSATRQLLLQTS
jgi:hypothetical protein